MEPTIPTYDVEELTLEQVVALIAQGDAINLDAIDMAHAQPGYELQRDIA